MKGQLGLGLEAFKNSRIESNRVVGKLADWVGLDQEVIGCHGSARVESGDFQNLRIGRVGSGRVGSGRVGSGRIGSGLVRR